MSNKLCILKYSKLVLFVILALPMVLGVQTSAAPLVSLHNVQTYDFSIFGSVWHDIINFFNHLLSSKSSATVSSTANASISNSSTISVTTTILTTSSIANTTTSTPKTTTTNPLGVIQQIVSIPDIQANTTNYLNKTIDIRAMLDEGESSILTVAYYQHGVETEQLYQYFSNNQTNWYFPLTLPNQPNRQWQYGSSYLFTGHLSTLHFCPVTSLGDWIAINSTACYNAGEGEAQPENNLSNSTIYCTQTKGTFSVSIYPPQYSCYPISPPVTYYYFNATNATLNG